MGRSGVAAYVTDPLLSAREVAGLLGCCVKTVRRLYRSGALPAARLSYRMLRIRRSAEQYIERAHGRG